MLLFISWSGSKSKAVAEFLSVWLKQVIQSVEPWISVETEKGSRWSNDISLRLENTKIGIICLTKDNKSAPWINFEAGAISKNRDAKVCTLLIDLDSSDVLSPLGQFQNTKCTKEDVFKLIQTINKSEVPG